VIAATQMFDEGVARTLLQMRIADFLVKPINRSIWCGPVRRVAKSRTAPAADRSADLYVPSGGRRRRRHDAAVADGDAAPQQQRAPRQADDCLVDLNFQHGAVADYLDSSRAQSRRNRTAAGSPRPPVA